MRNTTLRRGFVFFFVLMMGICACLVVNISQTWKNEPSTNGTNFQGIIPDVSSKAEVILDIHNMTQVENFTDNYMTNIATEVPIVGVTVSVVTNNTELFSKGYGYAHLHNSSPVIANKSMFEVASISKLFTWTCLMQLYEDGVLDLDENVNTYIDGFQIPDTFPDNPITVQHLMDHSSGLDHPWSHHHTSPALEDLARDGLPNRIRAPGEYSVYSTYEAILAGYVVQCVSGVPFEDYVDENIFEPLGMNHSSFVASMDPILNPYRVTGYEITANSEFIPHTIHYERINPGGGLSSTSEDLAVFMSCLLQNGTYNGESILDNETTQEMLSISYTDHPLALGWAHGWTEMRDNGHQFFGHGGISYWMRSHLFICPEEDFGIFISLNTPNGFIVTWDYISEFLDVFFPHTSTPDPSATPLPNYQERAQKFEGVFVECERPYTHFTKISELVGYQYSYRVLATDDGFIQLPYTYPGVNFVEVEENVFYYISSNGTIYTNFTPLIFLTDDDGKVQHLIFGNSGFGYDFVPWYLTVNIQQIMLVSVISIVMIVGIVEIGVLTKEIKKRKSSQMPKEDRVSFGKMSTSVLILSNSFFILMSLGMNAIFLPGILYRLSDWEPYPPSLYVLLTLPVISAIISSLFVVKLISDFIRRKQLGWKIPKLIYLLVYTVVLVLLYLLLYYWRLLGFHL